MITPVACWLDKEAAARCPSPSARRPSASLKPRAEREQRSWSGMTRPSGSASQLKAWIDCLASPGKTFKYSATGVEGLAGGKKLIIASSRGGFYTASSPMAFMDHQETFLTSFFGFIGITDAAFVRAEGVGSGPEQRKLALETALADVSALKAA
jgi:hypothetical protein